MRQHFHLPPATLAAAQPPAHIAQVTTQIVSLAPGVEFERVYRRLMAAPLAPDVQPKRMADEVTGGVDALGAHPRMRTKPERFCKRDPDGPPHRSPVMPRRLKVFRTSIGFHDAYVAAPSRKAALAAWGTTKDLFAIEAAAEVTDPELTAEPLLHPGQVIRKTRGELGREFHDDQPAVEKSRKKVRKQRPPPSRAALDDAENLAMQFEDQARGRIAKLDQREAALATERRALEKALAEQREKLAGVVARQHAKYRAALTKWNSQG